VNNSPDSGSEQIFSNIAVQCVAIVQCATEGRAGGAKSVGDRRISQT
jgi:hypothetical protein